ncbi:MAG: T9SS type A sorting domain-containing protein [Flavobacteriia bacterium]|nr:T9SS type A sorting domain-containing protein [Flavobacteriia bacterium]
MKNRKSTKKNIENLIYILCLIISYSCKYNHSYSQSTSFNFQFSDSIPVIIEFDTLKNAWQGGLNNPQFSTIDYDFDGDEDLFIFDRSSNNIRLYTNEIMNNQRFYKFVFNGKSFFPNDLFYRAQLIDYNFDGKKDLFTYGIGSVKVFKNDGNSINGLQWTLFKSILYSEYFNNYTNLYVSSSDIPAIVDVDFDGDIDILTFSLAGQHVEYHQNQSMELYSIPDSLEFILKNECWGKFAEDAFASAILLNDTNYPCVNSNVSNPESPITSEENIKATRHSGSTLLALDIDHSGVMDLIIGDVSVTNLNLVTNGGTTPNSNSAMNYLDDQFPNYSNPVDIQSFPASYLEDLDFDTKKDLIVCGNARNSSNNQRGVWFYKNNGTNDTPLFNYQTDAFIQKEMIDMGSGSIPVFFDYNQDGLEDLFIANLYRYKAIQDKESSIACFKNTGTLNSPEFTLITNDFLNLSQSNYNLHFVPTFGDLDNDGDKDLFLGLENGTIAYYENLNSSNLSFAPPILSVKDNQNTIISTGTFNFPQLFDLNKDGLLDLVLGKNSGEIVYYKNIGTITTPSFQLYNSTLGNIDVDTNNSSDFPTPHFFRNNDTTYLFIGNLNGQLIFYKDIDNHLETGETFQLVDENYLNLPTEAYSSFFVNDIDHDSNMDIFIGQDLGGLYHMEHNSNSTNILNKTKSANLNFSIYPNPTNETLFITMESHSNYKLVISDMYSKIVYSGTTLFNKTQINCSEFTNGIYTIQIIDEFENTASKRFVKLN